jgi:hypothetical protein
MRRHRRGGCGGTSTGWHRELAARPHVTRRFRDYLFERVRGGGANAEVALEEQTARYRVARGLRACAGVELAGLGECPPRWLSLDEAHHRRGLELATIVSIIDRGTRR